MSGLSQPTLSVIVTVVSDTTELADTRHLQGCLEALHRQVGPPAMEIIVTCDNRLAGIEELQRRFPAVGFIRCGNLRAARHGPSREHHDELRGIGIQNATAELIALLEDHGRPDPHWCAQLLKEHRQPLAAVGGAMENGIDSPLNWAVYFCDFGRYQNPVPSGPAPYVSDANVCYKRSALERVAEVWADSYNEIRVHAALAGRGETLWLSPQVVVYQHRLNLHFGSALDERYIWARSYAAVRVAGAPLSRRLALAAICPLLPAVLTLRLFRSVLRTRRNRAAFLRVMPLILLLTMAWSYGELVGYLTGRAHR
ncbi:MAG TPA: glycosyltransferase [Terriglobales bacterium]|nr:glycosyltransferase [Terriglobales bacterium]